MNNEWVKDQAEKSLNKPRDSDWGVVRGCLCDDCGIDVHSISEWFMLRHEVWPEGAKFLCVQCVENRIGRKLEFEDFMPCWGNVRWPFSKRLESRFNRKDVSEDWLDEITVIRSKSQDG